MVDLSVEEKITKMDSLISEGKALFITKYFEKSDFFYDEEESQLQSYTDVNHDAYPSWRIKSLAVLKNFLGGHSTYVKEFEQNCKADPSESYLRQGIGVLEAVKSGYLDNTLLKESPPLPQKSETMFQVIQVNENKNNVAVEYNVSNFEVLIDSIEKSGREDKEKIVKEIKGIQHELETGSPTWDTIQKWGKFALGLGKDLGINLLANIIAKYANIN